VKRAKPFRVCVSCSLSVQRLLTVLILIEVGCYLRPLRCTSVAALSRGSVVILSLPDPLREVGRGKSPLSRPFVRG